MSARLDRLGMEREKARQKRDDWDQRFKELDRKYREQENLEIQEMVHAANVTPEQLSVLLQSLKGKLPDGSLIPQDNHEESEEEQHDN